MHRNKTGLLIILIGLALPVFLGCSSDTKRTTGGADADGDADSDSDGDLDSDEVPAETADDGYVTFGSNWYGYAWTEVGREDVDTISPSSYDGLEAGETLCAAGTVAADGIGSYGMIAINIHQDNDKDAQADAVSLAGDGVTIDLGIETGVNQLIMELHGVRENPGDEHDTWCRRIVGYGDTYRWTDFTTQCYNNMNPGDPYNGEPIQFISITAPGNISSVSYDFCINDITLEDDIPEDEPEEEYPEKEGEICADQSTVHVYTQDPQTAYMLSNNVWNSSGGQQCLSYVNNSFEVTTQTNYFDNYAPASYPSLIYGVKTQAEYSWYSELPKRVSDLGAVTTHWSTNAGTPSGTYNAAYDVWFNSTENAEDEVSDQSQLPTGTYLMVWYHYQGGIQPIDSDSGENVTVAGQSWRIWRGTPGPSGAKHIAFVATGKTSLTFDLKDFIDIAVSKGDLNSSHYLSAIQAGFEIWNGGVGLKTNEFWVDEDTI
ncbi:MAG: hypothetical protein JXX29_00905 [Deltaproteobacteria bacterium]|nr:hypothetical protein [Deltaproteobacteria bacterium]MBN2670197.1 hypothetical protein [Deltaproteobacteria bacterium]